MNSGELQDTQEVITTLLCNEIKEPMKDWTLINKYLAVLKDIDAKRRELWNKEKFGAYEEMADNILEANFLSNDIPF